MGKAKKSQRCRETPFVRWLIFGFWLRGRNVVAPKGKASLSQKFLIVLREILYGADPQFAGTWKAPHCFNLPRDVRRGRGGRAARAQAHQEVKNGICFPSLQENRTVVLGLVRDISHKVQDCLMEFSRVQQHFVYFSPPHKRITVRADNRWDAARAPARASAGRLEVLFLPYAAILCFAILPYFRGVSG